MIESVLSDMIFVVHKMLIKGKQF